MRAEEGGIIPLDGLEFVEDRDLPRRRRSRRKSNLIRLAEPEIPDPRQPDREQEPAVYPLGVVPDDRAPAPEDTPLLEEPPSPGELRGDVLSLSLNEALRPEPTVPGFAPRGAARTRAVALPERFLDSCRAAYQAISFPSDGPRVLGVTSAVDHDGKTSVAFGISRAMAADTGEPTLLLECDIERGALARFFGIEASPGLSDWLKGFARLRVLNVAPLDNHFVVPAGEHNSDPGALVRRLTEGKLMDHLRAEFRNIVIELPPVLRGPNGSPATALADRVVLVARHGVTRLQDLEAAVARIGRARLAGVVLSGEEGGSSP